MVEYQSFNSFGQNLYNAYSYNRPFPVTLHFHKNYEILYCKRGCVTARISNQRYLLKEGSYAFIYPYEIHTFQVSLGNELIAILFPQKYIAGFVSLLGDRQGLYPIFVCPEELNRFMEKELPVKAFSKIPAEGHMPLTQFEQLKVKGILYSIVSYYFRSAELIPKKQQGYTVVENILTYIQKNYKSDISLEKMSHDIGYNVKYLSSIINNRIGFNFCYLVNSFRYEKAKRLMSENPQKKISDVAFESGFQSLRTFNRVYKEFNDMDYQ